ncbi:MAG: InlB B-repeat-containing protein [Lachnospiraceae bacterium]|nr:InlB B-repeat-containing protein [Lachnospiraceae bacterium]
MSREMKKITSYLLVLAMMFTTVFSNGVTALADDSVDGSNGEVTVTTDEEGNRTFKLTGDVTGRYEIELKSGETAVLDGQGYTLSGMENEMGLKVIAAEGSVYGSQTLIIKNINIKGDNCGKYHSENVGIKVMGDVNVIFEGNVNVTAGSASNGMTELEPGSDGSSGIEFYGNNMSVDSGSNVSVKASDGGQGADSTDGAAGGTAVKFGGNILSINDGATFSAIAGSGSDGHYYVDPFDREFGGNGGNGGSAVEISQGTLDISENADVLLSPGEGGKRDTGKGTSGTDGAAGNKLSYKSGFVSDATLLEDAGVTEYKTVTLRYFRGEEKIIEKSFFTTMDTVGSVNWLPEYDIEGTDGNNGWEIGDSVPSEAAGGTTVEPDKVNGDTVLSADEVNNLMLRFAVKKYNVTFDTNGGSEAASQVVIWGGNASQPENAPVKEGYTFAGWYGDKECTIPYDFSKGIKENTTIYAKWAINTYKVSFDTNGGSKVSDQTVEWNKLAAKPETEPVKEGFTFAGWYADKDCKTEYDFKAAVKADVTIYAKWTINSYKVTFDTNGGSKVSGQTVEWNKAAAKPETEPTKEGFTFAGWYADKDCKTEYDFKAAVKADVTIYAKWTINSYKVTFDTNGGSEVSGQSVEWNKAATKPETEPVKEGYTFGGWYTDKDCNTEYNFEAAVKADVTIYAKWTINSYKVTFDTNGGSEVSDQSVEWNDVAVKPDTEPTKEGYTFAGWYTDKDCNTEYNFEAAVKADVTIYAKWTINSYKVTFNSLGGSNIASQKVVYNDMAKNPESPVRKNCGFGGWYTDKSFAEQYDFSKPVTQNVKLYAKWYKASANKKSVEVKEGKSTSSVKIKVNDGDEIKSWKSSNTKVAKVDKNGKITGVKKGNATITVTTVKGARVTVKVVVKEVKIPTKKIKVSNVKKGKLSLKSGKSFGLNVVITPSDSTDAVKYTSSDKKIVTVDKNGKIKAVNKGKAKVTITSGKIKRVITVTVK